MAEIAQPKAMNNVATNLPSPILSDKASFHPEKNPLKAIKLKPAFANGSVLDNDDDCIAIDPPLPPSGKEVKETVHVLVDSIDNNTLHGQVII